MRNRALRGPVLLALLLVVVGVLLLLDNYLLLPSFNVAALLPLLLVVAGAQMLVRGDITPSNASRTFGITRGSVQNASLEISSGSIDVNIHDLDSQDRLIAGQYAPNVKPELNVNQNHATLRMSRSATPWFTMADWSLGLSQNLPWSIYVSTHLGQVDLNLSQVIVEGVVAATGFGDIRYTCPKEAFAETYLRSTLGNIHVIVPPDHHARVTVKSSRLFHLHVDETRFEQVEPNVYHTRDGVEDEDDDLKPIEILVSGTFGDAYLTAG